MIKFIEWSDQFSVGVELLDQQHKHLIELINILAAKPESEISVDSVIHVLEQMKKYAKIHFESEEQYLSEHKYAHLAAHKVQHREFEKKTETFLRAMRLPVDDVPHTVFVFLRYWWMDHILEDDMKYKRAMASAN